MLTSPEDGRFLLAGAGESLTLVGEENALLAARERARRAAVAKARLEGADDVILTLTEEIDAADIEGSRRIIEARITATAAGRPRIARG